MEEQARNVVLIGGGHAHVRVMKDIALERAKNATLDQYRYILICNYPYAYYSGMLPGCVATLYTEDDISMDLPALSKWTGFYFVHATAYKIDPKEQLVYARSESGDDLEPIPYHLLSLDVGSVTNTCNIPGVMEHALTTRPISEILTKIKDFELSHPADQWKRDPKVVIVGGGAAGVELCFGFKHRFNKVYPGIKTEFTVIDSNQKNILKRYSDWVASTASKNLKKLDVNVILGARVQSIDENKICLDDGKELEYDMVAWATGAQAPAFLKDTGLDLDDGGYIKVSKTLQTLSYKNIFACGDCCSIEDCDYVEKAGVYAVRAGPFAAKNIINVLTNKPPAIFTPQTGFLSLLMTGDGRAIGSWKGFCLANSYVWKLKDKIDRDFMDLYDVVKLGPSPLPVPDDWDTPLFLKSSE